MVDARSPLVRYWNDQVRTHVINREAGSSHHDRRRHARYLFEECGKFLGGNSLWAHANSGFTDTVAQKLCHVELRSHGLPALGILVDISVQ